MRSIPWSSRWYAPRLLTACLLAAGLALGCSTAQAAIPTEPASGPAVPDQAYEKVDAFLQERIKAMGLPGAAITVVKDGVEVHSAAFGEADQSGRPMAAQTPVLLASTTKSLTAIAAMQQVEAGRLRLDEPVKTYLPWFSMEDPRAADITVRHLLHQASGMAAKDTAFEGTDVQSPDALEDAVRALSGSRLAGVPGEAFGYANANFNILGLLVQTVSGQPFGDYMEQHVFEPLGMVHSHPTRAAARADDAAAGHSLWFSTFWRQTDVPASAAGMPSSTLYASAEDLGHELIALLDGGRYRDRRILGPESVKAMLAPRMQVDGSKMYAMGWFTRPLVESVNPVGPPPPDEELPLLAEHQGEWGNSHTYLAMVPSSRLGVALVINANDTSAPSRLKAIDTNILRILHGQEPVPAMVQEDWLQRYSWAVALGLLLVELLSLVLALRFLLGKSAPATTKSAPAKKSSLRRPLRAGLAGLTALALALDGFVLWLCLLYAPTKFDTNLAVIVRQFPDVGVSLVPALGLAILWAVPRTVWVLARIRRGSGAALIS